MLGLMHFFNIGVCEALDHLHARRRPERTFHRVVDQQRASPLHELIHCGSNPCPKERVSAAQMMVKKRERRANRKGMEPKCQLCQFDSHGIFIDAKNTPLKNHSAHDMAIFEMLTDNWPAMLLRMTYY